MSARAGVVITGTEVLSGRVRDRNGPWLADRLLELGIELAHVTICGDRPEDMEAQLRFMADQGVDVIITTGGLGPTADDLTIEVVAGFMGRPLELDEALEARIREILDRFIRRWRSVDTEALREANRKQALIPAGATVINPVGTAPGVVVPPVDGTVPTVVVMPGPPRELHEMWPQAVATEAFRSATRAATHYETQELRLFGIPEAAIADSLRVAEQEVEGFHDVEITTCLRRGEIEVVARWEPRAAAAWEGIRRVLEEQHGATLFSEDGTSIDDQVAELLAGRWIAAAESCTGGLMAARLTQREGASEYVAGGVVSYSNEAKSELLGVDPALIERHGAVSPQVADAMADGVLTRFEADTSVAITGIAGPGGGTEEKPVGYVCWSVKTSDGAVLARDVRLPGDRGEIRDRATTVAMHLLRRLLRGEETPF